MPFNDDEEPTPARLAGMTGIPTKQVQLTKHHSPNAPQAANDQKVLLELRGVPSATAREPLDLVAIMVVSGSMDDGGKLEKAKRALSFIISKLSDRDRLCIVKFHGLATRLCPLLCASEATQAKLEGLVRGLEAEDGTNIQNALSVVNERKFIAGRATSIMLMSN